ncbi:hypothetical protein AJ80_05709 [Polytolypa hystricis UAMH7299]|uniref:Ferritin n=1 Tax=Polytolypa hystricis (strain UAMH7299) TaxID=1447883 RepID=A0A2B7Y0F3_POLH7|nr:hypothetical protein AJ80_05709 [Polytolypa hystricis UAMH7299]
MEEAKKAIGQASAENIDKLIRINTFSNEIEESIRGHIHQELQSWFFFRKLAGDCARANVALHGFSMLWERSAAECFVDAHWLEKYLIQRGGCSCPTDIHAPKISWPDSPIEPIAPIREALRIEKDILEDLERLLGLASKCGDHSLEDVIQTRFLRKETKHVKDLGDLLQQVARVSKAPGHGIYQLDKELREHNGCVPWGRANDPDIVDCEIEDVAATLHKGL